MNELTNTDREPTLAEKASVKIAKGFPYFITWFIRTISYGIFKLIGFLKQVLQDALH